MNSLRIIYTATLLAYLFASIAQGQTVNTLVITENPTSLTATLNGVSQTVEGFVDTWFIRIPGLRGSALWQEPGENDVFNELFTIVNSANAIIVNPNPTLFILSDRSLVGTPVVANPDGATDTASFKLNGAELDVTFIDNGDAVPETATTLPLLSLGMAALGLAKRRLL